MAKLGQTVLGFTVSVAMLAAAPAQAEPLARMLRTGSDVTPVLTEHSAGLRCLGELIDQSGAAPVAVFVRNIDDTTVPVLNEERRLSMGGSFVLHTALSRMESDRVQGVIDERALGARRLTISGAWTQDDLQTEQRGVGVSARLGNYSARIGARRGYDFIAGDFATSVNGRVLLSTAVGIALARRGNEARLVIDDGRNGAEVGIDRRLVHGPQMAQRRILEAVALVHVAHYFQIDYRACLEASHASPDAFLDALHRYESNSAVERITSVQQELVRLQHLSEPANGFWNAASREALTAFQMSKQLPPTGRPSAVLYALLATTR